MGTAKTENIANSQNHTGNEVIQTAKDPRFIDWLRKAKRGARAKTVGLK